MKWLRIGTQRCKWVSFASIGSGQYVWRHRRYLSERRFWYDLPSSCRKGTAPSGYKGCYAGIRMPLKKKLTAEVPRIVEQNKTESKDFQLCHSRQSQRSGRFLQQIVRQERKCSNNRQPFNQTEKMLTNLNQTVVAKHHQQSRKGGGDIG